MEQVARKIFKKYQAETPDRIKLLDLYAFSLALVGAVLFVYVVIVGTFPFNSFLSGFIAAMGTSVITVCLRVQLMDPDTFKLSVERMIADYLLANLCLHIACICFLG
ncbi:unnamed protein product [Amoebophrya sp. A120]|nr:unnamed protein product [Amoebophrya sp. A120]|eukprot:GSA120T00025658001.1